MSSSIFERVLDNLLRNPQFGRRPCSLYRRDAESDANADFFAECRRILSEAVWEKLAEEQVKQRWLNSTEAERKKWERTVNRIDACGALARAARAQSYLSRECDEWLRQRLRWWASCNIPDNYLGSLNFELLQEELLKALNRYLRMEYRYEEDLFVSVVPRLLHVLLIALQDPVSKTRPGVEIAKLRQSLIRPTDEVLERLAREFGIKGLDSDDVLTSAILLVIRATREEYAENLHCVAGWALAKAKTVVKLRIRAHWEPLISAGETCESDMAEQPELRKQLAILRVFCELA